MSDAAITDLDAFQQQIGISQDPSGWHTVDQSQIDAFADVTLDHQFIHVDPERCARESPYKVPIAHGFLSLSMMSHLVLSSQPKPYHSAGMAVNYGFDRIRFPAPVPVDSRIRARRELLEVAQKDSKTLQIKQRVTVEIEGGEKPACVADWLTRLYYE
jgi:acyl dehydratase